MRDLQVQRAQCRQRRQNFKPQARSSVSLQATERSDQQYLGRLHDPRPYDHRNRRIYSSRSGMESAHTESMGI